LKKLSRADLVHKNIITLLSSFETSRDTSWIILPELVPLQRYNFHQISSEMEGLCAGLIAGLAHLHSLFIAHRDIKPDNIVVDRPFVAKLIDFDLALELEDIDQEVDDVCGTEGWLAPEVKEGSSYSPIKADLWACGRVVVQLLYMAGRNGGDLRRFAERLKADNPSQRPSLSEWTRQAPVEGSTHSTRRPHSPDTLELTPAVKRQRLPMHQGTSSTSTMDTPTLTSPSPSTDVDMEPRADTDPAPTS
jgi:serine/threonine protein kinase